jgi:hypothetical protein
MPLLSRLAPLAVAMLLWSGVGVRAAADNCAGEDVGAAVRSAVITLTASDFFDPYGEEMRSFVDTGSLGAVDAQVVSARPRGVVRSLTAVPARSLLSPYFGEDMKGIDVTVLLYKSKPSPVVRIRLQQECAKYLHNTFLYY